MTPLLIGIAGPSGAGKSELARHLSLQLPAPAALISLDSYYRPLHHLSLEERARVNFDHPDTLDWDLIRRDLTALSRGEPILEPVYLFDKHTRAQETKRVEPAPFVIAEGLFALHDPPVRDLLGASIYVDAPGDVCLERRISRDTVQRGRTRESVLAQYEATVRPMAERFVHPSRHFADLIVSGENPLDESWLTIRELLLQPA